MPNYSFKCPNCNHKWEDFLSISDRDNAQCPKCGAKAETSWGNSKGSVLIKGSGFYQESKVR